MATTRHWTILVYMAGDAGKVFEGPITGDQLFEQLEDALRHDLNQMQAAGSSDAVALCVQFDSLVEKQAFRWVIPPAGDPAPAGPQPIGAVNTGEPGSLSMFAGWAKEACPAVHYALVIWGHGTGWDETRIYDRYPQAHTADDDRADLRATLGRRGLFASTQAHILSIENKTARGLCYDDSSRDFLDNAELQKALRDAAALLGKPKIELLGLDACLMNMLEVAHQVRDEVALLVGSQAVVPGELWPWTQIVGRLREHPELAPRELALGICEELAGLPSQTGFTQSVLDLSQAGAAAAQLDRWARLIVERYDLDYDLKAAIDKASDDCLRFALTDGSETDYVDLYDLVRIFVEEWTGYEAGEFVEQHAPADEPDQPPPADELAWASARLLGLLASAAPGGLVVHSLASDLEFDGRAHGVSIYLPRLDDPGREGKEISPQYGNLELSDTAWPELLGKFYGQEGLPPAFLAVRQARLAKE